MHMSISQKKRSNYAKRETKIKHIHKYIFATIIALLLTVTVQSAPKPYNSLESELNQLKSESERLFNVVVNSNCTYIKFEVIQKLSDREYGINYNREFSKLYTSETSYRTRGSASLDVYRNFGTESVIYKSGFSDTVNSYRECSRRDKEKYSENEEKYSKANDKYYQAKRKVQEKRRIEEEKAQEKRRIAKKQAGCEYLSKNTEKGTISGRSGSILDGGFWLHNGQGDYYVRTSNASAKSIVSNGDRITIIVKRTGETRRFSLYELYPYQRKNGESEYSKKAMRHARRYPASKFKILEEVYLIGLWDSLCKE